MSAYIRLLTFLAGVSLVAAGCVPESHPGKVVIDLRAGPANTFIPDEAFGVVIDGLSRGRVKQVFTPDNIKAFNRAGLRSTAYTLRTELAIEAWHWTDEGSWSDPVHQQGYWTGSDHPHKPVLTAWGYYLPRRGDSVDQANDDGYSRLDDGDPTTFWKSNPYLDPGYARAPNRPQWVMVTFPKDTLVSAARIRWATPFATRYEIQYWSGVDQYDPVGRWIAFPHGRIANGRGGDVEISLSEVPLRVHYVRLLLQQSSHIAFAGSRDRRDAMGYSISEIGFGVKDARGRFADAVHHTKNGSEQTNVYVSSTDPWHRAIDRDPDVEQPGFDRVFGPGPSNELPRMVTVGALYDTPENTAAAMRFLKARNYPIREVEIGLEPDGQNISPEDFATLYAQAAQAVRKVDGSVALAGPGLQDAISDTYLDEGADHSWTRRFLKELAAQGAKNDLQVFTFEHYPNDVLCGALDRKLLAETGTMKSDVARLKSDGVPATIPWAIIEYGISAFSGEGEVEMPSALFNADMIANFLTLGGRSAYLLGYGPDQFSEPDQPCAGYGELTLFGQDAAGRATWPTPAFWGAVMTTKDWVQPGAGRHQLYRATWRPSPDDTSPDAWVVAYPLVRPDGQLAVMLINRDPRRARTIDFEIRGQGRSYDLRGPFQIVRYAQEQYSWTAAGPAGHPTRNEPPRRFSQPRGPIMLPPYSLTVIKTSNWRQP